MHRPSLLAPADLWAEGIADGISEELVSPLAEHKRLRPLLLYLLNNLGQRLSSAQAAKIVSVERTYFSRFFLRQTGFNFYWWDRELRISLATSWLRKKDRNIAAVGLALGYVDRSTFARAFKKCNGVGPQAYRRSRSSPPASAEKTALPGRAPRKTGKKGTSR